MLEGWVGPAIVAAVISGLISLIVVQLNFRQERRADRRRRDEKVRDFQIALRAEISSELLNLEVIDRQAYLAEIGQRYAADPHYSVIVPYLANNPIFESVVKEIHILPEQVIEPVVHYARLRQTVEKFVEDLRGPEFSKLSTDRQLAMYADYLVTQDRLEALAQNARPPYRGRSIARPRTGRPDNGSRGRAGLLV